MSPLDYLYIAIGIVIVVAAALAGLVRSRAPRKAMPRGARSQPPTPAAGTEAPAEASAEEPTGEGPAEAVVAPTPEPEPAVEKPEAAASRLVRLRQRLARSQGALGRGLLTLLSRDRLDEDTWESIEDTLLGADLGVGPTTELVERLRTRLRVEGSSSADARAVLRDELLALVDPSMDRRLGVTGAVGQPGIVLVVGVNGTGKTTTVGKLGRLLVAE